MKEKFILDYRTASNMLIRQRLRKVLRVRYGITMHQEKTDPVWLSAYGM